MQSKVSPIKASRNSLQLLNQRLLPQKTEYVTCKNASQTAHSIKEMHVRGAPAIGITAAYGFYLNAWELSEKGKKITIESLRKTKQILDNSRPTAVNLMWATSEMLHVAEQFLQSDAGKAKDANLTLLLKLYEKAREIHEDDADRCMKMSQNAVNYILRKYPREKYNILTHCNTGALATGGIGTALGAIRVLFEKNKVEMVYADETRPYLQGSRLTAWELLKEKIPVTLSVDSQAAVLMAQKKVDFVIVGADRITANGDVANKIGTYGLSVLAKAHKIPFFVVAPKSTFDANMPNGSHILIEQRPPAEVLEVQGITVAPKVPVLNYSFDVTPSPNITAIFFEDATLE